MITYKNRMGNVSISNEYFSHLIGDAVSSCYGVAGMVPHGKQKILELLTGKSKADRGIKVTGDADSILVDLHIVVTYGMNINAIAKSITNKVKYTVEEATGIKVNKVTVRIDGIKE